MRLTVLQHVACEDPGNLAPLLAGRGFALDIHSVHTGDPVPQKALDGLIILGGPQSVRRRNPFPTQDAEVALIRKTFEEQKPILGVCLGAQLLAFAFGGEVFPGETGEEIGWGEVKQTTAAREDMLFRNLPSAFEAFHWHGDTFVLPKKAIHLAETPRYTHQAFRLGENAYGLQFHLEVTADMVREWMQAYPKSLQKEGPASPAELTRSLDEKVRRLKKTAEIFVEGWMRLF